MDRDDERKINTQHLHNAVDQLRDIVNNPKNADNLPQAVFQDLKNIYARINEACGWTAETAKAAGVGGASGR